MPRLAILLLALCLSGCSRAPVIVTYADGSRSEFYVHPIEANRRIGPYTEYRADGTLKERGEHDSEGNLLWSDYFDKDGKTIIGMGRQ